MTPMSSKPFRADPKARQGTSTNQHFEPNNGPRWMLLISGVLGLVLTASFVLPPNSLPHLPLCQFKHLTGLPCPGCGLTRAFSAISHGQLKTAWQLNPFSFPLYALAVCFVFFPLGERLRPGLGNTLLRWRIHLWLSLAMLVGIWTWGLWRLLLSLG